MTQHLAEWFAVVALCLVATAAMAVMLAVAIGYVAP